jgi:Cu2+-exporting ATPase
VASKELLKLAPTEATIVIDGKDQVILFMISIKDLLRVKPGEKFRLTVKLQMDRAP